MVYILPVLDELDQLSSDGQTHSNRVHPRELCTVHTVHNLGRWTSDCPAVSLTELTSEPAARPGDSAHSASSSRPPHLGEDLVTALYLQAGEVYTVVTRTSIVGYNIQEGEQKMLDGVFKMQGGGRGRALS